MDKEKLNVIGWFLVALGLFNILFRSYTDLVLSIWYCDHITLLGGILILLRKRKLLNAVIIPGLIPVFVWIADFLFKVISGKSLIGVAEYVFIETNPYVLAIYYQHLFVLPLMIYCLKKLGGASKDALKYAVIYAVVLLALSIPFGAEYNLNCFTKSCMDSLADIKFILIIQYLILISFGLFSNWILWKTVKKN